MRRGAGAGFTGWDMFVLQGLHAARARGLIGAKPKDWHYDARALPPAPLHTMLNLATLRHWRAHIPTPCPQCRADSRAGWLCAACSRAARASCTSPTPRCPRCALRLGAQQRCPDCSARRPAFTRVLIGLDYAAPGAALVGQFKQGRQWQMAPAMAALLAQSTAPLPASAVLVAIPAHAASLRARGFNPAAELARALAQQLGLRYEPQWLLLQHDGTRQTHATRNARLHATAHDFICPHPVPHPVVAVVDDVMTTGSTLHHAARALRQAGAGEVWGLVLARTPLAHP